MKGMLVDRTLNYNEIIAFVTATAGPDGTPISPAEVEQALERLVDADIVETLWDDEGYIQYRLTRAGRWVAQDIMEREGL